MNNYTCDKHGDSWIGHVWGENIHWCGYCANELSNKRVRINKIEKKLDNLKKNLEYSVVEAKSRFKSI